MVTRLNCGPDLFPRFWKHHDPALGFADLEVFVFVDVFQVDSESGVACVFRKRPVAMHRLGVSCVFTPERDVSSETGGQNIIDLLAIRTNGWCSCCLPKKMTNIQRSLWT